MKVRSAFLYERRRQLRSDSWVGPQFAPDHVQMHRLYRFPVSTAGGGGLASLTLSSSAIGQSLQYGLGEALLVVSADGVGVG